MKINRTNFEIRSGSLYSAKITCEKNNNLSPAQLNKHHYAASISDRECIMPNGIQSGIATDETTFVRDDALGRLISQAFQFPPPKMPDFHAL